MVGAMYSFRRRLAVFSTNTAYVRTARYYYYYHCQALRRTPPAGRPIDMLVHQVTLAVDAHHRDVIEAALFSLVECLPSISAAEVWQADNSGSIRCIQGLAAGGCYYCRNQRVDDLLHEDDLEEFCLAMEPTPPPGGAAENSGNRNKATARKRFDQSKNDKKDDLFIREGLVIRPSGTPGIVAAPFRDSSCKVGSSWVGADRLARGFALVLRIAQPLTGWPSTAVASGRLPGQQGRSTAAGTGGAPAAVRRHGDTNGGNIEDGVFAARVARETSVALACVRGRERRAATRALALKRLSAICSKAKPSGKEAKESVLAEIASELSGCRAYVGVLQPGGESLLYDAATPNSRMQGRELRRGEGVSFACLDNPDGAVHVVRYLSNVAPTEPDPPQPPSLLETATVGAPKQPKVAVGDSVEVWYASSWLAATIVRDRGHLCYDVEYEGFRETEAGVPRWRLRELVSLEHLEVKTSWSEPEKTGNGIEEMEEEGHIEKPLNEAAGVGDTGNEDSSSCKSWPWPFVCVPLRSAGNRVGVLGVDGWTDVPLGRPEETHPEPAVVNFLKEAGGLLATALYAERRNKGLAALGATVRGKDTTEDSALEALIVLLRETVTFRRRVDVLETRAAEPGAVYCRGTWEGVVDAGDAGTSGGDRHCRHPPARVFEVGDAPRVEELCITRAQLKRLGTRRGQLPPPKQDYSTLVKDLTPYQREMHFIARDGPGNTSGLQATALITRRGEIVGRFQRLAVRLGGGRPSSDGWYLVRVARTLPEAPLTRGGNTSGGAGGSRTKVVPAAPARGTGSDLASNMEDGDVSLLSEMCRRLEVGFMVIASREQRALIRVKALDRVLACCKGFSVEHPTSIATPAHNNTAAAKVTLGGRHSKPPTGAAAVIKRGGVTKPVKKLASGSSGAGTTLTASGAPNASTSFLATPFASAAVKAAADAINNGQDLFFSAPVRSPTAAETPDGRKGALVSLRDGRLAVLVYQGEKRVAVVELPGGKQQTVAESEVGDRRRNGPPRLFSRDAPGL